MLLRNALFLCGILTLSLCGCLYNPSTSRIPDLLAMLAADQLGGSNLNTDDCLCVTEGGVTDSYTIVLANEPLQPTVYRIIPDDQIEINGQGPAVPVQITFTSENWNQPQTILISAIDDNVIEGDHTGGIQHLFISGDPEQESYTPADLTVDITDNDYVNVNVTVTSFTGNFTITLNGSENLNVTATGDYSFIGGLYPGTSYQVLVTQRPTGKFCYVSNGSGIVGLSHITDVSINCPNSYWMGGALQGNPITYTSSALPLGGSSSQTDVGGYQDGYAEPGTPVSMFSKVVGLANDGTFVYVMDSGNYVVRRIDVATTLSETVAGSPGAAGTADGSGGAARFKNMKYVTHDGQGNLYLTDEHTIRRVATTNFTVTTIVGAFGQPGSNDGTGTAARFNNPRGITTDGVNLYVSDYGNCTIRKIVIATFQVSTIAGLAGNCATVDDIGSAARVQNVIGITCDGTDLYFVQYCGGPCSIAYVRRLNLATGGVSIFAGNGATAHADGIGTAAAFYKLQDITTDGTYLYLVGWENSEFRRIDIVSRSVTSLTGGYWNTVGIATDGMHLYLGVYWWPVILTRW